MTNAGRGLLLAAALVAGALPANAASDWSAWEDVDTFRGRYEARRIGGIEQHVPHFDETAREEDVVTLDFEIERKTGQYTGSDWRIVRSLARGSSTNTHREEGTWDKLTASSSASFSGPVADDDIGFTLDTKAGTWEFGVNGRMKEPYVQVSSYRQEKGYGGGRWETESWEQSTQRSYYAHGGKRLPLPGPKPGPLLATWDSKDETDPARGDTTWHDYRWRVSLSPVWPDYEVIVKVEGVGPKGEPTPYEEWLPQGVIAGEYPAPFKVGSRIKATARLLRKGGGTVRVTVKQFRFELRETSREPGICMNWPQHLGQPGDSTKPLPDEEYDLRFDGLSGKARDKQQVQTVEPRPDEAGRPFAEAGIDCYDFGAWSTLRVDAELADGRTITGFLEGEPAVSDIPLPKRSGSSYVAEAWKRQERTGADDGDDDEKEPEGEPGCNGDGLSLYEEYRGFAENGRHVRTDPKRKDLFIYNRCGAVAVPGIMLFQKLSGLKVRRGMLEEERCGDIPWDYTAINGYVDRGPHRALQHRLEIIACGVVWPPGGSTSADPDARDRHLRPKDVEKIIVEGPAGDFWKEQYGIRTSDKPRQFEVAVAHELFHAVGVEHHGEGDYALKFETQSATDSENPTGRARWIRYIAYPSFVPVRLWQEEPERDITESSAAEKRSLVEEKMRRTRAREADDTDTWEWRGGLFVNTMQIGNKGGQHSGNEDCVMRYWLASAYPKRGTQEDYVIVPDGTEPVGKGLCSSAAGVSVNKSGRRPQPRYFDAAPGRGDCRHWVCVNDGVPAKSNDIPESGK